MQSQISSAKSHCELAAKQPIFETLQSCVCTTVTLSHRFKSSPAISGKVVIPGVAGYLMNAGHFYESHVSSGDLNRPRSPEVRKPLVYSPFFSYKRKEKNRFPFGKFRGSANLESARRSRGFANIKPSCGGFMQKKAAKIRDLSALQRVIKPRVLREKKVS